MKRFYFVARIYLAVLLVGIGMQPVIVQPAYAAIQSGAVWEVRTGGSDTNGGCFDNTVASPGTDFSQQNGAQITYTDLVIGATTTQYTSVLNPVDGTIPGNCGYIASGTAGCTEGFFEVLSRSGTVATTDRTLGTATTVCHAALGGALATFFKAWTGGPSAVGAAQACNTIWVKSGTYTLTTTQTGPQNSGGGCASIEATTVQGYHNTRGDNDGTRPLITTATNSTVLWNTGGGGAGGAWVLRNIAFSNTAATRAVGWSVTVGVQSWLVDNTVWDGFTTAIQGSSQINGHWDGVIANSEFKNGSGNNPTLDFGGQSPGILLIGDFIHDGAGAGLNIGNTNSAQITIKSTVIYKQNKGVTLSQGVNGLVFFCDNSAIDSSTGDAITFSAANSINVNSLNCVYSSNGGYAVNDSLGTWVPNLRYWVDNAFFSNTLGNYRTGPSDASDIALTASPWTSASTGDFSLNATAGGGAALKGVGFPGVTKAGTGYMSVGPLQPKVNVASGGGCVFFHNLFGKDFPANDNDIAANDNLPLTRMAMACQK